MPRRAWEFRAQDILEALEKIQRYMGDMDFEGFRRDEKTIDAVLRNITVIGEAAKHIPEEVVTLNPTIPWSKMRGMRDVLVHEYFGVSLEILWQTIQEDLPPLQPQIRQLLGSSH